MNEQDLEGVGGPDELCVLLHSGEHFPELAQHFDLKGSREIINIRNKSANCIQKNTLLLHEPDFEVHLL